MNEDFPVESNSTINREEEQNDYYNDVIYYPATFVLAVIFSSFNF